MTSINSDLHLVLPLRIGEDGKPQSWAYHTPISLQTFEANFRTLAATKAALFKEGPRYAFEVGARVAALHLRDAGRKDAQERLDVDEQGQPRDGGVNALLGELRRLTMIAAPAAAGWESIPLPVEHAPRLRDGKRNGLPIRFPSRNRGACSTPRISRRWIARWFFLPASTT